MGLIGKLLVRHREANKASAVNGKASTNHAVAVTKAIAGRASQTQVGIRALGRQWHVPQSIRAKLESWGPQLVAKIAAARRGAKVGNIAAGHGAVQRCTPQHGKLRVGTDCSGAEAPIWALRAMRVSHTHVFSCDWQPAVRSYIAATCPPQGPIFQDMLKRSVDDIPDCDVYICGFPCTPFSRMRRHSTKLMREPAAKPFFKTLEVLKHRQPPVAILENVLGITKVFDHVLRRLRGLGCYHTVVLKIDSADLGEPVSRPRFFFILVRRDVALSSNTDDMAAVAGEMWRAARAPVAEHVTSRMFPSSSPEVREFVAERRHRMVEARAGGFGGNGGGKAKWISKHVGFRQKSGVKASGSMAAADAMCLATQRQRDAWQAVVDCRKGAGDIIADISQNLDRAHVSTTGICPTIVPGGIVCVKAASRILMPIEKLLLHGFPVHTMNIPASVSDQLLSQLGGNAMHLKSVGLALLIGLNLLRVPLPLPAKVSQTPASQQLGKQRGPRPVFVDQRALGADSDKAVARKAFASKRQAPASSASMASKRLRPMA